jgi:hypothetical protein
MGQYALAPDPDRRRCGSDGDRIGIDLPENMEKLIVFITPTPLPAAG